MKKAAQSFIIISRFLFVLIILGGAFAFAMFQGGIVSWTIFYAVLPFGVYSLLLFFYPLSNFTVKREVNGASLQVDDSLKVKIILLRRFPFPLLYTIVCDEWSGRGMQNSVQKKQELFMLGWRRELTWSYEIEQIMRGEHAAETIQIEVSDFFGWIQKRKTFPLVDHVLVYPKVEAIHYAPLEAQNAGGLSVAPIHSLKDTNLVTGVRDYEQGDRMAQIHWKSFARTQTLMTKEFEDRGSENLQILLDNRPSKSFEVQVSFAASLLQEFKKEKVQIRFSALNQTTVFQEVQSDEQYASVFTYLAKIQPIKDQESLGLSTFGQAFTQPNTMIVISSSVDDDLLRFVSRSAEVRSIICFVVIEREQVMTKAMKSELKVAKSKGVTVRLIENDQVADAFKEVVSR